MSRDKCFVVDVELFDTLTSDSSQHLHGRDIETCHIVLTELHLWIHHSAQIVLLGHLEQDKLCLCQRYFDVEFTDLRDLNDQVGDLDVVVDLQHDVHRLVIVDIVVTLCKLLQVLAITIGLTALHPLQGTCIRILHRKDTALTITLRVRVDPVEALQSDIAGVVLDDLRVQDVLQTIRDAVHYDRDRLL